MCQNMWAFYRSTPLGNEESPNFKQLVYCATVLLFESLYEYFTRRDPAYFSTPNQGIWALNDRKGSTDSGLQDYSPQEHLIIFCPFQGTKEKVLYLWCWCAHFLPYLAARWNHPTLNSAKTTLRLIMPSPSQEVALPHPLCYPAF